MRSAGGDDGARLAPLIDKSSSEDTSHRDTHKYAIFLDLHDEQST